MGQASLDDVDKQILESLYMDATLGASELAEELSIEEDTVHGRLDSLSDEGLIGDTVAVVDPYRVGSDTLSYHLINFQRNYDLAISEGINRFGEWDGAQLAMIVLGDYDVIARKISRNESQLDIFASNVLSDPDTPSDSSYGPLNSQVFNIETFKTSQRIRWRGTDFEEDEQRDIEHVELSDLHRDVANALLDDGTLIEDIAGLATRVSASVEDVEDAIQYLEETDCILNYSNELDPMETGWYRAFFSVSVERGRFDDVAESIQENTSPMHVPYVVSALGFSWADIAMELVFDSIEELDEITDRLRELDGVQSSKTFLGTRVEYFDYNFTVK